MIIGIRTDGVFSLSELKADKEFFGMPILIMDDALKIVAKNKEASMYTSDIRIGAKLNRFIPESDIDKIKDMRSGEILLTSVNTEGAECRVNVLRGIDCRVAVLYPVGGGVFKGINEKYGRMSGYDLKLSKASPMQIPKSDSHCVHGGIAEIVDRLASEHTVSQRLPFFDSGSVFARIVSETKALSPCCSSRLICVPPGEKLITAGSERDFALMAAFAVAFCLDCSDGEVYASALKLDDRIEVTVACEIGALIPDMSKVTEFRKYFGGLKGEMSEPAFWAYLLRLFADSNLWELDVRVSGGNRLEFIVRMPFIKSGEEFWVRDFYDCFVHDILLAFLGVSDDKKA